MKWFFWCCVQCVVVEKYTNITTLLCKVDEYHYIEPNLNVNQWDSLNVGDTLMIDKKTLMLK